MVQNKFENALILHFEQSNIFCYSETYIRHLKIIRKKKIKSEAGNLRSKIKRITVEKLRLGEAKKKIENAGKRR
jgi:hypothetical protein